MSKYNKYKPGIYYQKRYNSIYYIDGIVKTKSGSLLDDYKATSFDINKKGDLEITGERLFVWSGSGLEGELTLIKAGKINKKDIAKRVKYEY